MQSIGPFNLPGQSGQFTRTGKSQYSETEAAEELGISVPQLRTMIRSHVVERDEDMDNLSTTTFQPSDLVILRLLAAAYGGTSAAEVNLVKQE